MKARIVAAAIAAATSAAIDLLTGRDPARRAQPTAADAERLADKLIAQRPPITDAERHAADANRKARAVADAHETETRLRDGL